MENYKDILYNWVLHFNPYKNAWAAIPKDLFIAYCNNSSIEGVIYSDKVETLIDILYQINGNVKNLNQLK